jgi:hypothetical protein
VDAETNLGIKMNYCDREKIPLLIIPYTEKQIELSLKIFLKSIQNKPKKYIVNDK